jgi:hypothetical protein
MWFTDGYFRCQCLLVAAGFILYLVAVTRLVVLLGLFCVVAGLEFTYEWLVNSQNM